ncbi:MAG: DUF1269 domain-containing protein [Gammaproteobacteria bacterium]|nr:DUF1269 domain-containing protein [Gammaproteobacteria bacterium]NIR97651.1 DUF1269 domain-containing protein [Gammaproteobacteria bacterium]NIT63312.1 DUF1269 domain-containing protein [Gammaproteobacteria bacterium]NIV20230.1 DUF1269 domain-containing protein [Gammaproteobacteria bacterium]NIX10647.1 DUF1269 domain-containing protein [Gammaproteobacteria bacterium]
MRRRLYLLVPDIDSTRRIVDELLLARIDDEHIHVLAREGAPLDGLPEATIFQKSDLAHELEVGLVVGGATGTVAGVIAVLAATGMSAGGLILACALAGAWVSTMVSVDVRNSRLRAFERAIEQGQLLLMVDVPKGRVDEINELVRMHREARAEGSEPTIPAFP